MGDKVMLRATLTFVHEYEADPDDYKHMPDDADPTPEEMADLDYENLRNDWDSVTEDGPQNVLVEVVK